MTTSIYQFASALNSSARPSQFRVHINFPAGLVSNGNTAKHAAVFLTRQAQIPSYNTSDVQVFYRGRVFHEAGEKQYDSWSCTVYNSSDFMVRIALEQWVNAIHDPEVVAGITQPEKYKSTIVIEQLDRNDNTLRVYKLYGAYPTQLGPIQLDYSQSTEVQTFEPTFVYDYFVAGGKQLLDSANG